MTMNFNKETITILKSYKNDVTVNVTSDPYCPEDKIYITTISGDNILEDARKDYNGLNRTIKSYESSFIKRLHFLFTGEFIK